MRCTPETLAALQSWALPVPCATFYSCRLMAGSPEIVFAVGDERLWKDATLRVGGRGGLTQEINGSSHQRRRCAMSGAAAQAFMTAPLIG
jgi:hypothetical protein